MLAPRKNVPKRAFQKSPEPWTSQTSDVRAVAQNKVIARDADSTDAPATHSNPCQSCAAPKASTRAA